MRLQIIFQSNHWQLFQIIWCWQWNTQEEFGPYTGATGISCWRWKHGRSLYSFLFWVSSSRTSSSLLWSHELKSNCNNCNKNETKLLVSNHTWHHNHEYQYSSFTHYSTHPWHHPFLTYVCAANELVNTKKAIHSTMTLPFIITHLNQQLGSQLNVCFTRQQKTDYSGRCRNYNLTNTSSYVSRQWHTYLYMCKWKHSPCQLLFKVGANSVLHCVPSVWDNLFVADPDKPVQIPHMVYKGLLLHMPYRQTHADLIQDLWGHGIADYGFNSISACRSHTGFVRAKFPLITPTFSFNSSMGPVMACLLGNYHLWI